MDTPDPHDHRLTELEIKAAYTEDMLDELNRVVVRQQQQIEALLREMLQLRDRLPDSGGAAGARNLRDELPPHY